MRIERRTAGDLTFLACTGEVDAEGVRALRRNADAAIETGCQRMVVSLGDVSYSDSRALAHLVRASQSLTPSDREVVYAASSGNRRMLKTLGLAQRLELFPDDQAAVAHVGGDGGALGLKFRQPFGRPRTVMTGTVVGA